MAQRVGTIPGPHCWLCLGDWKRGTGGTSHQHPPSVHLGSATKASSQTLSGRRSRAWSLAPGEAGKPVGTRSNRPHRPPRGNPCRRRPPIPSERPKPTVSWVCQLWQETEAWRREGSWATPLTLPGDSQLSTPGNVRCLQGMFRRSRSALVKTGGISLSLGTSRPSCNDLSLFPPREWLPENKGVSLPHFRDPVLSLLLDTESARNTCL